MRAGRFKTGGQRTLGDRMRRVAAIAVPAVLLAGPTILAFDSGGYFTDARLVALVVAWLTLAAAALAVTRTDLSLASRDNALRLAVGGLALLAVWTWVSASWAPLGGPAVDARERALLYLAVLLASALAFARREVAVWAEPVLAAGAAIVIGYGVLGEFDVLDLEVTASAGGRLDQPLTYWNAEGVLAAMGLVLATRIAGSTTRPQLLRPAAAAAAPLLGLGVYLTFSRGALTALAVGLAILVAFTPTWSQLRATAIALEAAVVAVVAHEALPDPVAFVVVLGVMLAAAAGQAWSAQSESDATTRTGPLPGFGRLRTLAWVAAVLLALAPFAAGVLDRNEEPTNPAFGATAERLSSSGSHRYTYWRVALETFADDPAVGIGAGGFQAAWLERRDIDESVRDAHSLPLETAAELGVVGLLFLGMLVGGVIVAIRRVGLTDPALAAGPAAALAVWASHTAIDWDWEMPAVTLVAAVLAGVLLARGYHRAPS
jgi:hypothetical protein